jgi:tetratricopeptide (TPR) repeat protein
MVASAFAAPIVNLPSGPSGSAGAGLSGNYRRGLEHLLANRLPAAKSAFEAALKESPKSAAPALGLAEVAYRNKDNKAAEEWIRRAVATDPQSSEARASLGRLLRQTGRHDAALVELRRAIELDPKALTPRLDMGELLTRLGRPQEAVPIFEQAVAIDARHAGAHFGLGVSSIAAGDPERGLTPLDTASRLEPKNPLPHVERAAAQMALRRLDEAAASADRALKLQPGLLAALLVKGDISDVRGDTEQALNAYAEAHSAWPKSGAPVLRSAMLQHRLGKLDAAMVSYRDVLAVEPNNPLALNNLAVIATGRGKQLGEAEGWARKAVSVAPTSADFHDTLGSVLRARGKLPEARQAMERAVELAPDSGEMLYRLAQVQAELGDSVAARQSLDRALTKGGFPSADKARALRGTLGS